MPSPGLTSQESENQALAAEDIDTFEYAFEGVTFGGMRSPIGVGSVTGLSRPDGRLSTTDKLTAHGSLVFVRYMGSRIVQFTGTVFARDIATKAQILARMDQAFALRDDDTPLFLRHGDGVLKQLNCRPTKFTYPADFHLARGPIQWAAEFVAGDPAIYDADPQVIAVPPEDPTPPGFGFPLAFPLSFGGGGSGGFATLSNAGTMETSPIVQIQGPASNPILINVDTGDRVSLTIDIADHDVLVLDFAERTIMLGDESRYYALDAGSVWWDLDPGDTQVQFVADGATEETVAIFVFRSAWGSA